MSRLHELQFQDTLPTDLGYVQHFGSAQGNNFDPAFPSHADAVNSACTFQRNEPLYAPEGTIY